MATYKTCDLINLLCKIIQDGYEYVDISEISDSDPSETSLAFSGIEDFHFVDYDSVDSCEIPSDFDFHSNWCPIRPDDICAELLFTYEEIVALDHAVDNALEYFKECLKDPCYSKETKQNIKSASIDCRNLQAKFKQTLKHLRFS